MSKTSVFVYMFFFPILLLSFQNCAPGNKNAALAPGATEAILPLSTLADQSTKSSSLNETCQDGYDHCFEGTDLPGSNARPRDLWTNPIDDDWRFFSTRQDIRINGVDHKSGHRFLRAWRMHRPGSIIKDKNGKDVCSRGDNGPAWIFKRDPFINDQTGFEAILSIRIPKASADGKVAFTYVDGTRQFSLAFNSDSVLLKEKGGARFDEKGGARFASVTKIYTGEGHLDLSREFRVFHIIKRSKGQGDIKVYDLGEANSPFIKPVLALQGVAAIPAKPFADAQIGFGLIVDEVELASCAETQNLGQYDLSFLRFGRQNPSARSEIHPLPPISESTASGPVWNNIQTMPEGGGKVGGLLPGKFQQDGFTLEWEMQFESTFSKAVYATYNIQPESKQNSGNIQPESKQNSGLSYTVIIDPQFIRAAILGKPVTSNPIEHGVDLTQWHRFRLVKSVNSLYAYLYIDENPIPILAEIAPGSYGSSTDGGSRLLISEYNIPLNPVAAWRALVDIPRIASSKILAGVFIKNTRLSSGAWAPAALCKDHPEAEVCH